LSEGQKINGAESRLPVDDHAGTHNDARAHQLEIMLQNISFSGPVLRIWDVKCMEFNYSQNLGMGRYPH